MKEETDKLHERYYEKFWQLQKNKDALGDGVIDVMRQNILNEYKDEYAIMLAADLIQINRELHSLSVKSEMLTPKKLRFRLFWKRPNRAEDQLDREMFAIVEQLFAQKEQVIQGLIDALECSDDDDPRDVYEQPEPEGVKPSRKHGDRRNKEKPLNGQVSMDELGATGEDEPGHDERSGTK